MKDRISKYPGRVQLIPVEGQPGFYDVIRADEPEEPGTPISKATLLKDQTAAVFGLGSEATVNDVLAALPTRFPRPVLTITTLYDASIVVTKGDVTYPAGFVYAAENDIPVRVYTVPLGDLGVYTITASWGQDVGSTTLTVDSVSLYELDARMLQCSPVFANNSWSLIAEMCRCKLIPETWNIGDTKILTLAGNVDQEVRIYGKGMHKYADTDRGTAPLTFEFVDLFYGAFYIGPFPEDGVDWVWKYMALRSSVARTLDSFMPEIRKDIAPMAIHTYSTHPDYSGEDLDTVDSLFLLSYQEMSQGYYATENAIRAKRATDGTETLDYVLRTTSYAYSSGTRRPWISGVTAAGGLTNDLSVGAELYVRAALVFCF